MRSSNRQWGLKNGEPILQTFALIQQLARDRRHLHVLPDNTR